MFFFGARFFLFLLSLRGRVFFGCRCGGSFCFVVAGARLLLLLSLGGTFIFCCRCGPRRVFVVTVVAVPGTLCFAVVALPGAFCLRSLPGCRWRCLLSVVYFVVWYLFLVVVVVGGGGVLCISIAKPLFSLYFRETSYFSSTLC